jgi:transcriptional regulator with XRE-family HTH domain
MATQANALGDYLRARRQHVCPEDVGLVRGTRRRVAGLRREELAMLAGISAEYYLRLEVGRDKNPSAQVLDALARALRLDIEATRHLHELASPTTSRWDRSGLGAVAEEADELIDELRFPAIVANRYLDVLAAIRSPGRCHPNTRSEKTCCAGVFSDLAPANSTSIGIRRPRIW